MKPKLIRITTVPISLKILLKDQLKFMNKYFNVIGVSSPGKELDEVASSQQIRTVSIPMSRQITPLQDLLSLYKMIQLLKKEKPDIVHTHTPKAGLIGMLSAWITGVPHRMHTVAGLPLMETTGIKKIILLFVEKLTYACATDIYPNSYGLQKYIETHKLAAKQKTKVIAHGSSNGIDTEYFQRTDAIVKTSEELRKKYHIKDNTFVYIFVGRVVKDKGIEELLKSFEQISKTTSDTVLLIVGNREDRLDPISFESKHILKTNPNIIEAGFQENVRAFFAMADALVFPSYREGFPNVVLQAGAMELPAIVTDINGCNEIIENGVNGLIVPPKNTKFLYETMKRIKDDTKLYAKLQANTREKIVKLYEREYVWKALLNEYRTVLGNNHA
jgi:glycosyltransferase involved in cell wall biosynthesis